MMYFVSNWELQKCFILPKSVSYFARGNLQACIFLSWIGDLITEHTCPRFMQDRVDKRTNRHYQMYDSPGWWSEITVKQDIFTCRKISWIPPKIGRFTKMPCMHILYKNSFNFHVAKLSHSRICKVFVPGNFPVLQYYLLLPGKLSDLTMVPYGKCLLIQLSMSQSTSFSAPVPRLLVFWCDRHSPAGHDDVLPLSTWSGHYGSYGDTGDF